MKKICPSLLLMLFAFILPSCSEDSTTTPPDTTPEAYTNASIAKGGMMYDKFWSIEAGYSQSDPNLALFNAKSDFFRCKQCHGWDLLGTAGSYNGRGPKPNRPNVSSINLYQIAKTKTPQALFDAMKKTTGRRDISYDLATYDPATNSVGGDQMPNLTQIFSDAQMWDIVKFLREGAFDVSQLYDATYAGTYPTGTTTFANLGKDGNAANGAVYFGTNCAGCHGAQGNTLPLENMTLGAFTRSKANEVQHKAKYGQPGSGMSGKSDITLSQMKDLYKALADTTAFPK